MSRPPSITVLVTGGAGFIGSHLCDALLAVGRRVRVLDDLSSGSRENLPAGVELIVGDITDGDLVAHALDGVDACCHLAAIASVERGVSDWPGTHRVNLSGTIMLMDAIRARPIPFVYASSAAVYGDCGVLPIVEDAPKRPLSAYGADKYGCELHAAIAARVHGIPTTGLRFFNVYGPRQDPRSPYSGVISVFCQRLASGAPIRIFGDGAQTRDFVYVADVVRALMAALDRSRGDAADVFNVCSGSATSVLALVHTIAALTGASPAIEFLPARRGDIRHSLGSPALGCMTLGLAAPVPLELGLAETLEWLDRSSARLPAANPASVSAAENR